jgi:hypothetical protein
MVKARKFRVGQKVQSIYDSTHMLVIDKSQVPDRIYHEKGSDRWWTRNELQRLGEPENPATSFRLNGKGKMRGTRSNASTGVPVVACISSSASSRPKTIRCPECGDLFQPKRPWQRFHSESCRRAHWRRPTDANTVQVAGT